MKSYNAKIVRFDNYVEVVKFGKGRYRSTNSEVPLPKVVFKSKEEKKDQALMEQSFRIKRKIKYYCLANSFDLFWTLTLNDKKVNAKNYIYARKKLQAWLKYMRETYGRFVFLFVPELHKSGRIHFHGLTQGFSPPLIEARYPTNHRLIKKRGVQIYNAPRWNNGFSTVSKIQSQAKSASYITKYVTKDLMNLPSAYHQPRYFVSRGLKQPTISYSIIDDEYFENLRPSFVVRSSDDSLSDVEDEVSIFHIDVTPDGEMVQYETPETFYQFGHKKSSDCNQSS